MNNAPGAPKQPCLPLWWLHRAWLRTLDNLGLFGSQWYQPKDGETPAGPVHYDIQDIHVNVEPRQR